jgi:hypothetical protein
MELLDQFEGTEMKTVSGLVEIWDGNRLVAVTQCKAGEVVRAQSEFANYDPPGGRPRLVANDQTRQ